MYIVITLVAVIVGLLGKKKKPAGEGDKGPANEARPGFLENLERAFNMEQQEQVVDFRDNDEELTAQEEMVEAAPEPISKANSMMEEYDRLVEQRRKENRPDMILSEADSITEPMEVIQLEDEGGTDYFEVVKEFDAGTAVVYSAIINRVDY